MGEPLAPFVTQDLSLAAYLMKVGGMRLLKGGRGDHGNFEFVLEDDHGDAEALQVEWSQSCCREFEQQVKALKGLLRSQRGGRRR